MDSRKQFLPDLAVEPVRPGAPQDEWAPDAIKALRSALPKPPPVDGPAQISYVLGSFNRRRLLEHAIESVRSDCSGVEAEIIVVDGGSTDGSVEWLCSQQDIVSIIQHNRYLKDGESRRRMSWGRFMNIGFRAASAPWIAMISDDCYVLPGSTSAALARVRKAEAAGLSVGGCAFYFRDWPLQEDYHVQRTLGGNLMVNHGLFSRAALEKVGYANEHDYAFYKADTDLSLRLWGAGYVITDCREAICEHYMSPEEAARVSNTELMDYDRSMMRLRWPGLIGPKARKMGAITLAYQDPLRTAERVFGGSTGQKPSTARAAAPAKTPKRPATRRKRA